MIKKKINADWSLGGAFLFDAAGRKENLWGEDVQCISSRRASALLGSSLVR